MTTQTQIPTSAEFYALEHSRSLHELYAPPGCVECGDAAVKPPAARPSRPAPMAEPVSKPAPRSLGEVLEDVRARLKFTPGPIEDELSETPDGDPYCPRCRGFRWLAVRGDDQERTPTPTVRCPECLHASWAVQKRVDRLLGQLPLMFRDWRLDSFPCSSAAAHAVLDLAHAWLNDTEPSWLFLWGPTGRGKTGLAVGLLYELALRGKSVGFKITTDLLTAIKSTFDADGEASEASILEVLHAVDVFVLDDLGSEYHRGPDDWAAEKLFQTIGGRHATMKRTIITSNYSLQQLQDRLGHPRTLRRVAEMTGQRWVVDVRGLPNLSSHS